HDPTRLLARTKSGTLRLTEDRQGLAFELDLPATTLGADMLALASRGDLGGMSFGFRSVDEDWQPPGMTLSGKKRTRELRAVELVEISVVSAWPAYEGTSVQARQKPLSGSTILSPAARAAHLPNALLLSPAARRRFLETL